MAKILFLTTANLSTNPRLVKEALLAIHSGHQINIVAFDLGGIYQQKDQEVINKIGEDNVTYLTDNRSNFLSWLFFSLLHKFISYLFQGSPSVKLNAYTITKRTMILDAYLRIKKRKWQVDIVIAHNIGAFYPAYVFAKSSNIQLAIDIEDYHPGELVLSGNPQKQTYAKEEVMRKILPSCMYVSFASPIIEKTTINMLSSRDIQKPLTLLNSFYSSEFRAPSPISGKIRFIWFSQYLSLDRGLRLFLNAVNTIGWADLELSLIGLRNETFDQEFEHYENNSIKVITPMTQTQLHQELSTFDIGLAIDLTSHDFNRDIALTNKIFAYYQAGLYSIITDTAAQRDFLNSNSSSGILTEQSTNGFEESIGHILLNIDQIRNGAEKRYQEAKSIAFENEGKKLLPFWS